MRSNSKKQVFMIMLHYNFLAFFVTVRKHGFLQLQDVDLKWPSLPDTWFVSLSSEFLCAVIDFFFSPAAKSFKLSAANHYIKQACNWKNQDWVYRLQNVRLILQYVNTCCTDLVAESLFSGCDFAFLHSWRLLILKVVSRLKNAFCFFFNQLQMNAESS